MNNFNDEVNELIKTFKINFNSELNEDEIRPEEALLKLNQWLAQRLKHEDIFTETSKNISQIAKEFPVVWSEKDTYKFIHPLFKKEDYIDYLSSINNSFSSLPVPNYFPRKVSEQANYLNFQFRIYVTDIFEALHEKRNSKDNFKLSFKKLRNALFSSQILLIFLVNTYNQILDNNYLLSSEWCSAHIFARYKGGDKNIPKNFRPIMVLPILVRLLDCILAKKLHDIVLYFDVIDKKVQKAVLRNSSGLWENLFEVNARIHEMIQQNKDELFLFIDLKNAFGSVNYGTLLHILKQYDLNPQLSNYIARYYQNSSGIYQNQSFKWKNGLFQGSALSNILFLIYIDFTLKNIFQDLKGMKFIQSDYDLQENSFAFVDDIALILSKNEKTINTVKLMQLLFSFYGFTINQEKTYFIDNNKEIEEMKFGDVVFKKATKDFKYLGHSLFLYENDIFNEIHSNTQKCLITIDSFNIPSNIKAYIYYTNIFMRINRLIECFYLIKGKTEKIDKILELVSYFIYRWGIPNFENYMKNHFEYISLKSSLKLVKSQNLRKYQHLVSNFDESRIVSIEQNEQDFTFLTGVEKPKFEDIESHLQFLKDNKQFPSEYFKKSNKNFYCLLLNYKKFLILY